MAMATFPPALQHPSALSSSLLGGGQRSRTLSRRSGHWGSSTSAGCGKTSLYWSGLRWGALCSSQTGREETGSAVRRSGSERTNGKDQRQSALHLQDQWWRACPPLHRHPCPPHSLTTSPAGLAPSSVFQSHPSAHFESHPMANISPPSFPHSVHSVAPHRLPGHPAPSPALALPSKVLPALPLPSEARASSPFLPTAAALVLLLAGTAAWLGPVSAAWADVAPVAGPVADADLFDLSSLQDGFVSSFLLIFFSEIGDKTFFIAVLLALQKSKASVFAGTFGALAVMSVLSVALGRFFHLLDEALPASPIPLDDVAAVILLVYFGVTTLQSAVSMSDDASSDEEEEEAAKAVATISGNGTAAVDTALATVAATFALVFVAEWGDKSFFSTIALAAAASPLGVVAGAIAGHGAATAIAVLGGSFLRGYISPKIVSYTGGILFLVFAVATLGDIFLS